MAEPASPRRGSAPASMLGDTGGSSDSLSTLRERYLDGAAKPSTPAPSRERLPDHELPPPGSASQGASLWKEVEQLRRALATAEAAWKVQDSAAAGSAAATVTAAVGLEEAAAAPAAAWVGLEEAAAEAAAWPNKTARAAVLQGSSSFHRARSLRHSGEAGIDTP
jgi:hypothetical protein